MGKPEHFRLQGEGFDKIIPCREGESLLVALAGQGYATVSVGCRNGGCGVCKIKVTDGTFEVGKMSIKHVSPEEQQQNYTLACRTYPKSDLKFTLAGHAQKVIRNKIKG